MGRNIYRKKTRRSTKNDKKHVDRLVKKADQYCIRNLKEVLKRHYAKQGYKVCRLRQIDTGHYIVYFKGFGPYGLNGITMNKETMEKLHLSEKEKQNGC